jgi:hypothetical protein
MKQTRGWNMKGSARAATALAVGYMLGRKRKFRNAALMAAATAIGGTTVGGLAMRQGKKQAMKMLGSSGALGKVAPQVTDLVDVVRGDLLTAGKSAVTAAATNRVDRLTDSIHDRAERVRNPASAAAEGAEGAARGAGRAASAGGRTAKGAGGSAASAAGGTAQRLTGRGRARDEADDEYEDSEPEYAEPEKDVADDRDEYPDDGDADEEPEAPSRRRSGNGRGGNERRSGTTRRSPVTRAGR